MRIAPNSPEVVFLTGLKHQATSLEPSRKVQLVLDGYRLAGEMVAACEDAEKIALNPAALAAAKEATAKAQLEYLKAEIPYRVAHAQLMATTGN
jgi:hypothetical protein